MLGASDRGIAMLRRILWREMEAVNSGKPTKQWQRTEDSPVLFKVSDVAGATQV
jgi:hypothetical protein